MALVRTKTQSKAQAVASTPYSFWGDSYLLNRINVCGYITAAYDGAMSMAGSANYFTGWAGFSIYTIPSFIPFLPKLINKCRKKPEKLHQSDEEEYADQIAFAANADPDIEAAFSQVEPDAGSKAQRKLIISAIKSTNKYISIANLDKMTVFINSSYLTFRVIRGASMIMEMYDLADEDFNKTLNADMDMANNIISYLYMVALVLSQYIGARNTLKKIHKPVVATEVPATLFSESRKASRATRTKSELEKLKDPLIISTRQDIQ